MKATRSAHLVNPSIGGIGVQTILAATLAFAFAFTIGCEEKSGGKVADSQAAAAELAAKEAAAKAAAEAAELAAKAEAEETAKAAAIAAAKAEAEKAAKAVSCKGDGDVKLLGCITFDDGGVINKFQYDKQNRIVKIYDYSGDLYSTTTITYNSDNLITVKKVWHSDNSEGTTKLVREGDKIGDFLTLNKDGYVVKRGDDDEYEYVNGNMTGYQYDDKKSPFSNTATPKWLLQYLLDLSNTTSNYASKNNVIESFDESGECNSEYEYDSDGFPTKQTRNVIGLGDYNGQDRTEITRYTYRGKEKNAPVEADK